MSNEPIYRQVMKDVEARAEVGKKTYGRYLMADVNGRDPVQDAYEEALDMAHYLKQVSHERLALIEYVARLEGALRFIKNDLMSPSASACIAATLATSPLAGQPQPAPATGWRPIAEAPNGEKLVVGRRLESKRWVMACLYKYEAVSMFYTHYYPIAAPPQEGE